mgnify:CR=1 FL=1
MWFKQLIFELESVRDRMIVGDAERARHYLTRVHAIERVLIDHIQVLETMTPQDFLEFRSLLTPASGFQSVQFREVEFISGLKQRGYLRDLAASPEDLERLEETIAVLADSDLLRQLAESDADLASGQVETADELAEAMRQRKTTA